ncbi:MAG: NlpC/P60 family protein [Hyphomicrobiales bacterium]|nr:NlpC/P60 family protein [Hyphomicrobiales bacterium]
MRADVVAAAQGWIGTPYQHQGALRGAGCDCLGLVRGVFAEVTGRAPEAPPPYSRDWAEAAGRETMLEAARRHLREISSGEAAPGDVLIFRMRAGAMAKHAAILSSPSRMIHACEGAPVCEVHLGPWWRRRIASAFRFPD